VQVHNVRFAHLKQRAVYEAHRELQRKAARPAVTGACVLQWPGEQQRGIAGATPLKLQLKLAGVAADDERLRRVLCWWSDARGGHFDLHGMTKAQFKDWATDLTRCLWKLDGETVCRTTAGATRAARPSRRRPSSAVCGRRRRTRRTPPTARACTVPSREDVYTTVPSADWVSTLPPLQVESRSPFIVERTCGRSVYALL
jgi:hypothetical protein